MIDGSPFNADKAYKDSKVRVLLRFFKGMIAVFAYAYN